MKLLDVPVPEMLAASYLVPLPAAMTGSRGPASSGRSRQRPAE